MQYVITLQHPEQPTLSITVDNQDEALKILKSSQWMAQIRVIPDIENEST